MSPDLLAGLGAPDDAAVWKIDQDRAVVITTDFFTPIVDDPYDYGAIAACNALSDLYAMGAAPVLALNIACLPVDLPAEIVREITRGAAEMVLKAGAVIAGGHTIQDREPKVGLVAVGLADPSRLLLKGGARPGDILVLTKPIGTGVVATALKASAAEDEHVQHAVLWMTELNQAAAEAAGQARVHAATDITGFSLLGHAVEMAKASGVRLTFAWNHVPLLPGAQRYTRAGHVPGGSVDNAEYFSEWVAAGPNLPASVRTLLFDAQTSGGLLLAVPEDSLADLMAKIESRGGSAWVVGRVDGGEGVALDADVERREPHFVARTDAEFEFPLSTQ